MDEEYIGLTFDNVLVFGEFVNQVLQSLMSFASRGIGLVNINRVSFQTTDGQEFVHKRRVAMGWMLIIPGNLVFRLRCVPVKVLHKREWMRWESDVKLATRGEDVTLGSNLICHKIPGESLSLVMQANKQYSEKKELLLIATESLKKFHETRIKVAGAKHDLLSHGDASIVNVLYDSKTKLASWFDFDLRHDLRSNAIQRHADDLRSLLYSAVHLFHVDSIEDWIQAERVTYCKDEVWAALAKQISSRWFAIDVFHHSQMARVRKNCGLSGSEIKQLDLKLARAICDFAQRSLNSARTPTDQIARQNTL